MDFSLSEEQTLLRNSVQSFLADSYDFEARRKSLASDEGYSEIVWKKCAELGLLALPFGEKFGGLNSAAVETMLVMEEFGRALLVEPYVPSVILAGSALRHAASEEQKQAIIPGLAAGDDKWALAFAEPQGRYDLFDIAAKAKKDGTSWILNGHKAAVPGGGCADKLLVSARTAGGRRDKKGISLFAVDAKTKGVERRDYKGVDGIRGAEINFDNVRLDGNALIGEKDNALPALERTAEDAIAALGAEAVGCMKALNEATIEYCRTRKQFGQPIGSFQVIQHRLVDMFVACEQAVSMVYMVTLRLADSPEERALACAAAKARIGQDGRYVGQQAVQLHGGMGTTDELHVGHHFKRLTIIDAMFGNADYHLKRYGDLRN